MGIKYGTNGHAYITREEAAEASRQYLARFPVSDKPREWWLVFPHDPYREMKKVCNSESAAKNYGASESITHVIEYSAYESCVKAHDENVTLMKEFQKLMAKSAEEIEALIKERDEAITTGRRLERARSEKLVGALNSILDMRYDNMENKIARAAIAEYELVSKQSYQAEPTSDASLLASPTKSGAQTCPNEAFCYQPEVCYAGDQRICAYSTIESGKETK